MKSLDIRRHHRIKLQYERPRPFFDRELSAESEPVAAPHEYREYAVPKPPRFKFGSLLRRSMPFRWNSGFRWSMVFVPFLIVVVLSTVFLGIRLTGFANSISVSHQSAYQNITQVAGAALGNAIPVLKNLDNTPLTEAVRGQKRVNILMLGYGGDGHSGAYLTDSIMVLSLDFADNNAALISIPRDTWVKIPTSGYNGSYTKINAAYEYGLDAKMFPDKLPQFTGASGGGEMAKYVVSDILGMPIDYYVAMDFSGFKDVVDALDGVDITVDHTFTDYTFPNGDENSSGPSCSTDQPDLSTCRYKILHFDAGTQHMDGSRALDYVRSRHAAGIEGSDFARSKRQQKLISAIQGKILSLNAIPKMFQLMDAARGHFQTDLSLAEMKDLSGYVTKFDLNSAAHISLTDAGLLIRGDPALAGGAYYLVPAHGNSWEDIHSFIFKTLNHVSTAQR